MTYFEFFLLAEENLYSLIFFSMGFLILYLFLYRKYIHSVYDPLFFAIAASGLANAMVFYLFYLDEIKDNYFYSFILTEASFIIGFFVFKPVKKANQHLITNNHRGRLPLFDESFITILFFISSIIHILCQLTTYAVVGLPILMDSRLTTYSGGSGFGFVGRMLDVSSGVGTFILFYRLFYKTNIPIDKVYNYFYLIFLLFSLIVSGNKTNLLFLIYFIFCLNLFMLKIYGSSVKTQYLKTIKLQKKLLVSSILLAFFVAGVQLSGKYGETGIDTVIISIGNRIVSFGDIFYMTLPNEVILNLNDGKGAFLQLFKDPLGMFRIINWSNLPQDNGFAVSSYHYGDADFGPNPRYNYFAMLYFSRIGMVCYCFVIGLFLSFLRNKLFTLFPKHIFFGILYTLVSINLIYAFQDMPTLVVKFVSIITFFPILIILTLLFMKLLKLYNG